MRCSQSNSNAGYGNFPEDAADEEQITHSCYFPTTKAPDNKALDSLPNRALGKAVSPAELSSDADEV
jgi:hypothetical protein